MEMIPPISQIISGGQTGVDLAALDFAMEQEIPHGGFCPKGRIYEEGTIPLKYQLIETSSYDYLERTEKNVIHSDGTLILYLRTLSGGTLITKQLAKKHCRPLLMIDLEHIPKDAKKTFLSWLKEENIKALNVAGPRESKGPIYHRAKEFLKNLLRNL